MSDFFIHAQRQGESFGVAIVEALQMNLPVLTWQGDSDRNHTYLVDKAFQYKNRFDLVQKIRRIYNLAAKQNMNCGEEFRPEIVMEKFLEVFPIN